MAKTEKGPAGDEAAKVDAAAGSGDPVSGQGADKAPAESEPAEEAGLVSLQAPKGFCDGDIDGFRVKTNKAGICRVPARVAERLLGDPHGFKLA